MAREMKARTAFAIGPVATVAIVLAGCAGRSQNSGAAMAGSAGGATANAAHSAAASNAGKGAVIGGAVGLIGAGNAPDHPQKDPHEEGARDAAPRAAAARAEEVGK
jgi:hypothetical protein